MLHPKLAQYLTLSLDIVAAADQWLREQHDLPKQSNMLIKARVDGVKLQQLDEPSDEELLEPPPEPFLPPDIAMPTNAMEVRLSLLECPNHEAEMRYLMAVSDYMIQQGTYKSYLRALEIQDPAARRKALKKLKAG